MNRATNQGPQGLAPTPAVIRSAREAAGLTQTAAAALVYSTCRAWQKWEAGDARMHPGLFELFEIKAGQLTRPNSQP